MAVMAIIFGQQGVEFARATPGEPGLRVCRASIVLGFIGLAAFGVFLLLSVTGVVDFQTGPLSNEK